MYKTVFCTLAALGIHVAPGLAQEAIEYSRTQFHHTCELLISSAVEQAHGFSGLFYEIHGRVFSEQTRWQIERMGFTTDFETQEVEDGNIELRLLLPTSTMPGSGTFIFRSSDYEVPKLNTNIEYFFCRAEPLTKTIFQIGVRMWHEQQDADTFFVSPEMMADASKVAERINTPKIRR